MSAAYSNHGGGGGGNMNSSGILIITNSSENDSLHGVNKNILPIMIATDGQGGGNAAGIFWGIGSYGGLGAGQPFYTLTDPSQETITPGSRGWGGGGGGGAGSRSSGGGTRYGGKGGAGGGGAGVTIPTPYGANAGQDGGAGITDDTIHYVTIITNYSSRFAI